MARAARHRGASGSILGLLDALLTVLLRGTLQEGAGVARRRLVEMGVLVTTPLALDVMTPQVSLLGHSSGIIVGFLVGLLLTAGTPADTTVAQLAPPLQSVR